MTTIPDVSSLDCTALEMLIAAANERLEELRDEEDLLLENELRERMSAAGRNPDDLIISRRRRRRSKKAKDTKNGNTHSAHANGDASSSS